MILINIIVVNADDNNIDPPIQFQLGINALLISDSSGCNILTVSIQGNMLVEFLTYSTTSITSGEGEDDVELKIFHSIFCGCSAICSLLCLA